MRCWRPFRSASASVRLGQSPRRLGQSLALAVSLAQPGAITISSLFGAAPSALAQDRPPAVGQSPGGFAPADGTAGGPTLAASVPLAGTAFALPPLSALRQTRERPLFSPGRRPPPAVAPPPPPPQAAAPPPPPPSPGATPPVASFVLTGIAVGPDARVAILRNVGTNAVSRVQRGETIDGWAVVEIAARAVVLRNATTTTRLELFPTPEARR